MEETPPQDILYRAVTKRSHWPEGDNPQPQLFMRRNEEEADVSFFSRINCAEESCLGPAFCEGDFNRCFGEVGVQISFFKERNLSISETPLPATEKKRAIPTHTSVFGLPTLESFHKEEDARSLAVDLVRAIVFRKRRNYKK